MLTKDDKKFLKETFVSNDDFRKTIRTEVKQVVDNALKPVKKDLKYIRNKLNTAIRMFDRHYNYHHRRLEQLEEKTGVEAPPYIAPKTN